MADPENEEADFAEDANFAMLLKPLQDLTKNWDIDISLHLDEYLKYVRDICGEDIMKNMNFSSAAIVLSNSASVYCKKIDYLAIVVQQLLDTLSIKQNEDKADGERVGTTRRRRAVVVDTESFELLEDICTDRSITTDVSKYKGNKKKQQVVLNAAIKVKPKENTTCNVYNHKDEPMGKKDEFRLNWKISSGGTLHEDFAVKKTKFQILEPLERTIVAEGNSFNNNSFNDDSGAELEPPPSSPILPLATSLQHLESRIERDSELPRLGEIRKEAAKEKTVDAKEVPWQPVDPNQNLPEKPIKKRNVIKIPPGLNDKKRKISMENGFSTFTITDCLIDPYTDTSFGRDLNFSYLAKQAARQRNELLRNHRAKFMDYLEKEAAKHQIDDFHGFFSDDDEDLDPGFDGFDDVNDADAADIDAPLPDDIVNDHANDANWQGEDGYLQAAAATIAKFKERRIDHGAMTDRARRVEEWHQKITPKLEEAESRSSFDIHGYGTKVLDKFGGKIGFELLFEDIVRGESKEEVARYFLSSLLLANQNNVDITKTDENELSTDCMKLKLLSLVRHHEELDDNMRQASSGK